MLHDALSKLVNGQHLTADEADGVLSHIMDGEATEAQIGALLVALRMKGETADEIAGFATAMRAHCLRVEVGLPGLVDTCGTGGDTLDTFNISTTAAFVAAGAGVPVAKHGNRAVSSQCGSADVLGELGVNIALAPEAVARCIAEVGIGFMFAPSLHPAMRHAAGPRRELAMRTIFNLLGPLTNPAGAKRQVIGVFNAEVAPLMAEALRATGSEHVLLVHGAVGLDEIALTGVTHATELSDGTIARYDLTAADFGLPEIALEDIAGGDPPASAEIVREVLSGQPGPRCDIVLANAAAAIYVGGMAAGLREGVRLAHESVDSGAAIGKLQALCALSQELA
jgi:anthranilate phosphoribosyltransferase